MSRLQGDKLSPTARTMAAALSIILMAVGISLVATPIVAVGVFDKVAEWFWLLVPAAASFGSSWLIIDYDLT